MTLNSESFRKYIDSFNENDEETVIQSIDNASAWAWLEQNMPLFDCPDKTIEETYYFRWWVYRKHLKETPNGYIITEFHPSVPWAGKHNSINCGAPHHINEGRWLLNQSSFLPDYIRFWFKGGGNPRAYSAWIADAIWAYCCTTGSFDLAIELLPDLVSNFRAWESSHRNECGLFWSYDDRDAMEFSISGSGLRPTLNSYLYADAAAIAKIARLVGQTAIEAEFSEKAAVLKKLVQEKLWDAEAAFFKVVPLREVGDRVTSWDFASIPETQNVREQIGYIPWYFNLPDAGYEEAWKQLGDPKGFHAPYGPTTAERRHPRFMFRNDAHECLWNGPSWPFATSQTMTALANLLNNYEQNVVSKEDYLRQLAIYTGSHYRVREDGRCVSWVDENLDPFSGEWLSRRILAEWNWRPDKGGRERGKDYNHSTYCDLIISGLVGLRSRSDKTVEVNPLVPEGKWDYFCLDRVPYHGRMLTIQYDRTGSRYGSGAGLYVYADGREIASSVHLERIMAEL